MVAGVVTGAVVVGFAVAEVGVPVAGVPAVVQRVEVSRAVRVPAGGQFEFEPHPNYTVFAHAIDGGGSFAGSDTHPVRPGETVLFGPGGPVRAQAGENGLGFLLVSGRPLHEPVAWYGPIVMNTDDQLRTAVRELEDSTFIKHRRPIVEE